MPLGAIRLAQPNRLCYKEAYLFIAFTIVEVVGSWEDFRCVLSNTILWTNTFIFYFS